MTIEQQSDVKERQQSECLEENCHQELMPSIKIMCMQSMLNNPMLQSNLGLMSQFMQQIMVGSSPPIVAASPPMTTHTMHL
jgi:hypothetical protein